ncbi:MAG: EamA family transporter [Rhodospirillaceae bacterium]|nr:EamA family transporter [Rhodospirillaceae bacterium]
MQPWIVALVLLAALLHAGWNAVVKLKAERLVVTAILNASAAAIALAAIPFLPLPQAESRPYLLASLVLQGGYFFFLLKAYGHGDLSHVYPIARGSAPLLVTALSAVVAGEVPSATGLAGILIVTAAILSLALRGGVPLRQDPRPILYALATGLFIASYTVVDGLGARRSGSPAAYIAWLFFLEGIGISAACLIRYRSGTWALALRLWKPGLLAGAMSLAAYGLVVWALTLAPMGPVSALRETGVVFAAVLGSALLKERFGAWRIAAALGVAVGIIVMET